MVNPTSHRILIIDDEEPILFAMKEYFTTFGYEVDCAQEMEEAEAMLANIRYSVVIVDLRLTGSHGAEGLEIVGDVCEMCPWAYVVLLTAYGSPEVEGEARRRGVHAFLNKPQPLTEVARIIEEFLETSPCETASSSTHC